MRILAIYNGEYGRRHIANLERFIQAQAGTPPEGELPSGIQPIGAGQNDLQLTSASLDWHLETWQAPAILPPVIDYPEDYLPASLPQEDLILSFAEVRGVAELLPDIAQMTGAQAVLAPVDNEAWLPRGLARQLRGWLERMGVACATPKPLCSLTETDYSLTRRERLSYDSPLISEFARYFGQPVLRLHIDESSRIITAVDLQRDAVCGCARFVADGLVGASLDEAEEKAGLLHHHFPCLASMGKDPDFGDTLMHISGNILKDSISEQLKPYRRYLEPGTRAE